MKSKFPLNYISAAAILAVFSLNLFAAGTNSPRERLLLDFNWKFHLGNDWGAAIRLDKAGTGSGPAGKTFNDADWRTVNLPHDWAVELPFDSRADKSHGFKPVGPGFAANDVAWYRRTFDLPRTDSGRRLWLEFDGVFRDCEVFVNGWFVGHHEGGYNSFRCDITDVANPGGKNFVAVKVDASQFEGWFYEGAGIYRHVWLVKTAPVAIAPDGIFVWSKFDNNMPADKGEIHISTRVLNSQSESAGAVVEQEVFDPEGNVVDKHGQSLEVGESSENTAETTLDFHGPELWSPESPKLYKLVTTVESGGIMVDCKETEFGIRTVAFDPDKGFLLNGRPYEIKGTCNHQDAAGVGAALPDALQYFRIAKLKEFGCNAYRTSHNPPTPELLEACDRLGMLVMDENRLLGSDAANLARLKEQILRDRNHPGIVMWSICNEEPKQAAADGGRVGATMQNLVRQLDPTRPITAAESVGDVYSGLMKTLEVRGWNYHVGQDMDDYHAKHPQQSEVGSEQGSSVTTRGIYENDKKRGYVSAYDLNFPKWANSSERWVSYFADRPWLSGGFYWTGFDYRGEPTPYAWPCINSHFGILDTCGFPKDAFWYYQSSWTDRPVLHLLPHWNWPGRKGRDIDVWCYSNCKEVELFLNGQSLGRKTMPKNSHLEWNVKYEPGTLSARGYDGDKITAETQVETTGKPAVVQLESDRATINADGEDVSVITVSVCDSKGRVVPVASNMIHFELSGPGKIIGVGNGGPGCHEPDIYLPQSPARPPQWQRSVFNGLAQVLVQSTKEPGEIKLTASASGLSPATTTIQSQPCDPRPTVP